MIARCIVDEGASVSILFARAWQGMGSSSLVSTASQLLAFDRRTCIDLGILAQTPVTLGGKIILVDCMVIEDPLDFNVLLGCDYVYAMQAVVSTFFHVMYFNHGKEIITIDQLDFLDPSPDRTRDEVFVEIQACSRLISLTAINN